MASPIPSNFPSETMISLLKMDFKSLTNAATIQNEDTKNYLLNTRIPLSKVSQICIKMRQDILLWTETYNNLPLNVRLLIPNVSPSPTSVLDVYYIAIPVNMENFKKIPFKCPFSNKYLPSASDWCVQNGFTDTIYDATTLKLLGFYDLVVQNTNYLDMITLKFHTTNFRTFLHRTECFTHKDFVVFKNEITIQFLAHHFPQ